MILPSLVFGVIALVAGLGLRYWINRRRFNRRNVAGLEGHSSYEKAVAVTFFERIGKLIAIGLIIAGVLFLWVYSKEIKRLKAKELKSTASTHAIPVPEMNMPVKDRSITGV